MDRDQADAAEQAARRINDRRVLNGIFWVLRSAAPRRDLPELWAIHKLLQSLALAPGWHLGSDHGSGCHRHPAATPPLTNFRFSEFFLDGGVKSAL
jgi:hypothetical protein